MQLSNQLQREVLTDLIGYPVKGGTVLLSNSQAWPGRNFSQPRALLLVKLCMLRSHLLFQPRSWETGNQAITFGLHGAVFHAGLAYCCNSCKYCIVILVASFEFSLLWGIIQ